MNEEHIAEFIETMFSYFAELEFGADPQDSFAAAASQACRATGFETEFAIEDGEIVVV